MGSSLSSIYNDYDDYVDFCKKFNEEPVGVREKFYAHRDFIMKKYGYKNNGCFVKIKDRK